VSAYPVTLEGGAISALVVGGGRVATRKALGLLRAGALVRVVSPTMTTELEDAASSNDRLTLARATYSPTQIRDATLVVAATDDATLNATIARDARAKGRLANAVDSSAAGNCTTPAVLRSGDVVVAVNAGGVPGAAKRIRDALAEKVDARYGAAVESLATLRRTLIDGGRRERWVEASAALVGDDFCELVESGRFAERVARWR
jgi:precorrin-2 dehydrogenase / sirohydrochlorin ferrochelatase